MRDTPTWRIPVGIFGLFIGIMVYAILIARYAPDVIGSWPGLAQTIAYLILGVIWLLPLRRFLIWMETGKWSAPAPASSDAEQE
ncbi:DUF2842 domain-containing protein [Erythrobacter sp. Alg231-14]|uniref:DUF2842 domain-containing protein n=1 Tax=Erythrobacter sp. Alg231-14 TaxID=1922225 RepID=UPI000D560235